MSFWDDALQELRRDFITGAVGRLSELEACIESLASDPRDASALAGIIGHFHRLAGAGASFGLPAVSRLGASGERSSLAVRDEGRGPTSEELAEWLQLLRDASAEFQRSSSPDTWVDGRADSSIASSAGRFQALVVDDDPDVVRLLRMILERHGGLVRSAASVAAAQDALSALLPDLLVVDVLLRDGSGHDLVERVRSLPRGAGVSILTCSSRGAGRERAEAVRRGADAFLQKPIDRGEVIARVDQLLSRPGLTPGRVAYLGEGGLARRSLESPLASLGLVPMFLANLDRLVEDLEAFRPDLLVVEPQVGGLSDEMVASTLARHGVFRSLPILPLQSIEGADLSGAVPTITASALAVAVSRRLFRERPRRPVTGLDPESLLPLRGAFVALLRDVLARPHAHVGGPHTLVRVRFSTQDAVLRPEDGDGDLYRVAGRIVRAFLPSAALACRFSSDEIGMLLPGSAARKAEGRIRELLRELSAAESAGLGGARSYSAHAGLAEAPEAGPDAVTRWIEASAVPQGIRRTLPSAPRPSRNACAAAPSASG